MKAGRGEKGFESIPALLFTGDFEVVRMLVAQKISPTLPQLNIPQDKAGEIAERFVLKVRANTQCRGVKPTRSQFWVIYGQIVREIIREYSPKWGGHKEQERELSSVEVIERDEKLSDVPVFSQLGELEEEAKEGEAFTIEERVSIVMSDDDYDDIDDERSIEDIDYDSYKQSIAQLSIHIERLRSDRDRGIMNSFLGGKKGKEIAESLGIPQSRVSEVIQRHLKRFGCSEGQIKALKLDIKKYT